MNPAQLAATPTVQWFCPNCQRVFGKPPDFRGACCWPCCRDLGIFERLQPVPSPETAKDRRRKGGGR